MTQDNMAFLPMNAGQMGGGVPQAPVTQAPPGSFQQQPATPQGGILRLMVKNQQGQSGELSDQEIMAQLAQAGQRPVGISPDGLTMTFQDDQGTFQVDTRDALEELGWSVTGGSPLGANYDHIQHDWRAAINKLPDDDMRQAYITAKMQRAGEKNPQVMGQGRDWYVFNPKTSQWLGVTNDPEWDTSDLVEGAMDVTRAIGSTAAATAAGGVSGGFGAMAGAAAGGAGVDAITRGAIAAFDPEYRQVSSGGLGDQGIDMAKQAGVDALGYGIFSKVPGLVGSMFGKGAEEGASGFMRKGLASTAVKGLGTTMEAAGGTAKMAAKPFQTEMGKDIAATFAPGLDTLSGAGWLAQLPKEAVKFGAKIPGWADNALNSKIMSNVVGPEAMQSLRSKLGSESWKGVSERLLKPRFSGSLAEEIATRLGAQAKNAVPGARDVLTNAAEMAGNRFSGKGAMFGSDTFEEQAAKVAASAYDDAIKSGHFEDEAFKIGMEAMNNFKNKILSGTDAAKRIAGKVGGAFDTIANLGESAVGASRAAIGIGAEGLKRGGQAMSATGTALKNTGTIMQPVENYALIRKGLDEYGRPRAEEALGIRKPRSWHPPMSPGMIMADN